jgi:hypothetical protein
MEERKNVCKILIGILQSKRPHGNLKVDERAI